jgi:hypothetical protein
LVLSILYVFFIKPIANVPNSTRNNTINAHIQIRCMLAGNIGGLSPVEELSASIDILPPENVTKFWKALLPAPEDHSCSPTAVLMADSALDIFGGIDVLPRPPPIPPAPKAAVPRLARGMLIITS